jgi:hypothetical protein
LRTKQEQGRKSLVAKFEVEVFEKAFVSVKKTSTSLLFAAVDKKFHFATSLKFLSPSSHL